SIIRLTYTSTLFSFFFYRYSDHRVLHSFPTRRSSDLNPGASASMTSWEALRVASVCAFSRTLAVNRCVCVAKSAGNSPASRRSRSEEHTSELQSRGHLVCRLLLEKKKKIQLYKESYQT